MNRSGYGIDISMKAGVWGHSPQQADVKCQRLAKGVKRPRHAIGTDRSLSLDKFQAFYINKYIDYHAFEITL